MKKMIFNLVMTISLAGVSGPANAANTRTNDILIKKLRKVRTQLSPKDSSRVPITLRLADLLSDQARRFSMEEN